MNSNEDNVNVARGILIIIAFICMLVTLLVQIFCNRSYIEFHFILRLVIVILSIVLCILDLRIDKMTDMVMHLSWALIWFFNMIALAF